MPKASLFSNPRNQAAAVAGAMAVLLIASLGAAYAMSESVGTGLGMRLGSGAGSAPARRLNFKGVSLDLPGSWSAIQSDRSRDGMTQVAVFGNAQASAARLLIAKLQPEHPRSVKKVLEGTLRELLQGRPSREVVQPVVARQSDRAWGRYIGVSAESQGAIRQHLLYVVTRNGEDYWLVYLTDLTASQRSLKPALKKNINTFERVVKSLDFEPDERPGTDDKKGAL